MLKTVEYARSLEKEHDKVFRFTITTNGMLLSDENIDYINREMSNVVLSLDGRKDVNDHMRPTAGGKGSYDVIVPKFQKLVAGRGTKDYYARGTVYPGKPGLCPGCDASGLSRLPPCIGGAGQWSSG